MIDPTKRDLANAELALASAKTELQRLADTVDGELLDHLDAAIEELGQAQDCVYEAQDEA